jgi:S1-C subfamily serine protease
MTQHDNRTSLASQCLRPRRATLLASVAGVGIAALVSGTTLYHYPSPLTWISPAAAAETIGQPSGFADLVARVKPAVISVRVRFNDSARVLSEPQVDSPAAKAGITSGDVITTLDGNAVKDSHVLARKVSSMAPGTSVKLGVLHNGSEKTVTLILGMLPDQRQANAAPQRSDNGTPRLGLTLAPTDTVGAGNQGVAVTAVDPNGPAAERGMQSGDVILDVAGKAVSSPSDVTKEIADLNKAGKHTVLMRVKSSNGIKFVAIPLANA